MPKFLGILRGGLGESLSGAFAFGNATRVGRLTGPAAFARHSNGCQLHPGADLIGDGEDRYDQVDQENDGKSTA